MLKIFRLIALAEGISYLLFAVTMPLKYGYDITAPNFVVGALHGALFVAYCVIGLTCAIQLRWKFGFSTLVFLASLLPFGTFYLDYKYLKGQMDDRMKG